VPESLRALLENLIDYAGLFPPTALDMSTAVRNYAGYLSGAYSWMLAHFVVPVGRLSEFEAAQALPPPLDTADAGAGPEWNLSVLLGPDPSGGLEEIAAFNAHNQGRARIDSVEAKIDSAQDIQSIAATLPAGITSYFEIAPGRAADLLPAIGEVGGRAKIRTGGLTPDTIPNTDLVGFFLAECARAKVPFKATAGLHHPLRGARRLTYEANAPQAVMYGFLNVFLAAVLSYSQQGFLDFHASLYLNATSPEMHFAADSLTIGTPAPAGTEVQARGSGDSACLTSITTAQVRRARREFAISFGSCSFEEPISELQELNLL